MVILTLIIYRKFLSSPNSIKDFQVLLHSSITESTNSIRYFATNDGPPQFFYHPGFIVAIKIPFLAEFSCIAVFMALKFIVKAMKPVGRAQENVFKKVIRFDFLVGGA